MSHIDCRRPRDLSPEERALLYRYCWGHAAAKCTACAKNFRHLELAADFLGHRTNLCPQCRADLTESMRGHLYSCTMLPEEVRQRAREARDAASTLIKQSTQAADQADGLAARGGSHRGEPVAASAKGGKPPRCRDRGTRKDGARNVRSVATSHEAVSHSAKQDRRRP